MAPCNLFNRTCDLISAEMRQTLPMLGDKADGLEQRQGDRDGNEHDIWSATITLWASCFMESMKSVLRDLNT